MVVGRGGGGDGGGGGGGRGARVPRRGPVDTSTRPWRREPRPRHPQMASPPTARRQPGGTPPPATAAMRGCVAMGWGGGKGSQRPAAFPVPGGQRQGKGGCRRVGGGGQGGEGGGREGKGGGREALTSRRVPPACRYLGRRRAGGSVPCRPGPCRAAAPRAVGGVATTHYEPLPPPIHRALHTRQGMGGRAQRGAPKRWRHDIDCNPLPPP